MTVAGLLQYDDQLGNIPTFANTISWLVNRFAHLERNLPLRWDTAVEAAVELRSYAGQFLEQTSDRDFPLTVVAIGDILRYEYLPLATPSSNHNFTVNLGLGRFRHLRDLGTGIDSGSAYVDAIWTVAATRTISEQHISPLPLIQTLDYLAYVLQADPGWTLTSRMTAAPDLQSAAALGLSANNEAEFLSRMTSLWNLIGQLKVPVASAHDLEQFGFDSRANGSLNSLVVWLRKRLGTSAYEARAAQAIGDIRAAGTVRNEGAHQSSEARQRAIKARQRLGLPRIVTDWGSAWATITNRVAAAFDVIREEVQGNPPSS